MEKRTKAYCNNCLGERNHEILFVEKTHSWNDKYDVGGDNKYEMLKCGGCDSVILRHTSSFSEEPEPTVSFYPPAMFRKEPPWVSEMVGKSARFARMLLREIYVGVQNEMKMITTMGVRALMEYVMIDSVGDQGTFSNNLSKFEKEGFISANQRVILDAVLEAGHATIHRAYEPSGEDLATCIDIAESVLQSVYVHPEKAAELIERVPRRRKTPAPTT
ncbi:MAG: DUF4145 domain-containing protein [Deltaproteobacteria bacterium]|nr:DUF4145 domain-containing protein [Deltaproteobacteria bacterium]